jgi:hypothetical protein
MSSVIASPWVPCFNPQAFGDVFWPAVCEVYCARIAAPYIKSHPEDLEGCGKVAAGAQARFECVCIGGSVSRQLMCMTSVGQGDI